MSNTHSEEDEETMLEQIQWLRSFRKAGRASTEQIQWLRRSRGDSIPGSSWKIQGSTTKKSLLQGVKDSRGRAGFMPRASVGLCVASHPSGLTKEMDLI
jgi:hypothetical protein